MLVQIKHIYLYMIKYAFSISEYYLVEDTQLITYANNQSQASSHVSYDVIGLSLRLGKKANEPQYYWRCMSCLLEYIYCTCNLRAAKNFVIFNHKVYLKLVIKDSYIYRGRKNPATQNVFIRFSIEIELKK